VSVVNMDELKQKAQGLTEQHGDKLEGAVDKGSQFAKDRFDGHDEQIDSMAGRAKDYLRREDEQ
jgi:MT0933-like antitoxin protein